METQKERPIYFINGKPAYPGDKIKSKITGKVYVIPDYKDLCNWSFWGFTKTPDGAKVEPDAPEGWLSILSLI